MLKIAVISSSVRTGRKSHGVALFLKKYITDNHLAEADLFDLKEYDFPVFEERLRYLPQPPENAKEFAARIAKADGVIVVTPEYNGGYPASLKNVLDLLTDEWKRKPVSIATVSNGGFGGSQAAVSLAFSFLKIGAAVVPSMFRVPNVQDNYHENGESKNPEISNKAAKPFVNELLWFAEALNKKLAG